MSFDEIFNAIFILLFIGLLAYTIYRFKKVGSSL